MKSRWKSFLVSTLLTVVATLCAGIVLFAIWTIFARTDETWTRRIGGAIFSVMLTTPFAILIFGLPTALAATATTTIHRKIGYLPALALSAILGAGIFPLWLFAVGSPLTKMSGIFSVIGAVSLCLGTIISARVKTESNKAGAANSLHATRSSRGTPLTFAIHN